MLGPRRRLVPLREAGVGRGRCSLSQRRRAPGFGLGRHPISPAFRQLVDLIAAFAPLDDEIPRVASGGPRMSRFDRKIWQHGGVGPGGINHQVPSALSQEKAGGAFWQSQVLFDVRVPPCLANVGAFPVMPAQRPEHMIQGPLAFASLGGEAAIAAEGNSIPRGKAPSRKTAIPSIQRVRTGTFRFHANGFGAVPAPPNELSGCSAGLSL
jgi:hypothetical protein